MVVTAQRTTPFATASSPDSTNDEQPLLGITAPYAQASLAAVMSARIAEVIPPEGTLVHQGDLIVQLDDTIQRARVEIMRAAAETTLEVELARAEWDRATSDLQRLQRLRTDASASSKELSDATAEAEIRRLQYELARFTHEQAVRAYEREQAVLDEHRLRAPFTGYVIQHLKQPGETADQLEGIVILYQLNPLKVVVDCPLSMAGSIKVGDEAVVTTVEGDRASRTGRVITVSRVADAGSQTFRVKIGVENANANWMAGMKVGVRFADGETPRAKLTSANPEIITDRTRANVRTPGTKTPAQPR